MWCTRVKIGFDLDGVVVQQVVGLLRIYDLMEDRDKAVDLSRYYYMDPKIQLNPLLFTLEEDELYFITGRNEMYKDLTEKFVKRFFPQGKLIMVNHSIPNMLTEMKTWYQRQAMLKANIINSIGLDVYIDDSPLVVRELRKLCPNTKILCYGGRIA